MLYFDTSFLAPLILEENTSAEVERFVMGLPVGDLAVSHWTRVEFSSLLAREVRMGGLAASDARKADDRFEAVIRESFILLQPSVMDYETARGYLGIYETGLRAGDALHLAVAANNRAEWIYSFNKTFLKAGRILGLPVSEGIAED